MRENILWFSGYIIRKKLLNNQTGLKKFKCFKIILSSIYKYLLEDIIRKLNIIIRVFVRDFITFQYKIFLEK